MFFHTKNNLVVVPALVLWTCLTALLLRPAQAQEGAALTLAEAERLALEADPAVNRFQALAEARRENAVADAQLPDPRLRLGLQAVPVDSFRLTQEPMTQLQVGVIQEFPRGRTLALRGEQGNALASAEDTRALDQAGRALRAVRNSYIEAYYQARSAEVIRQSRGLFAQLLTITRLQYAAARADQQDVLRARVELALLDDRETRILAAEEIARGELSKWIGQQAAQRPLAKDRPDLAPLPERAAVESRLMAHPLIEIEDALIDASRTEVELAEQLYKPGFALDVTYGLRFGENPNGDNRANFLSGMVVMDLPIFTNKRQDRRLGAAKQQAAAARYSREDRLRDLLSMFNSEYANWLRLDERVTLFRRKVLPESGSNADAALLAYQSGVTEFTALMRAYLIRLDNRLQALRVEADRAKTQANLLYLVGETP